VKAARLKIPYFETMHVAAGDTDNTRASTARTQFDARAGDEVETWTRCLVVSTVKQSENMCTSLCGEVRVDS
jgi:hypothetical protein